MRGGHFVDGVRHRWNPHAPFFMRDNLIELLKSLDQTLVIATCNMDFAARLCERAVLVDGGKIMADGNVQKIMSDRQLMEKHGLEVPAIFL